MAETRKQFFVRVKGDAARPEAAKQFGDVQLVDAGVAGEYGFVTPVMSEAEYQTKAAACSEIISMIRIRA